MLAWIASDDKYNFLQVYLGEQYVNNPTLSDVTFLVEGLNLLFSSSSSYLCYML